MPTEEALQLKRYAVHPALDDISDEDSDMDSLDDPTQRTKTKRKDKPTCLQALLMFLPLLLAITILLTILYLVGVGPWHLTHSRVTYGPSKYANVTCWNTTDQVYFVPWGNDTSYKNESTFFEECIQAECTNMQKFLINRVDRLKEPSSVDLQNRTWVVFSHDITEEGVIIGVRVLHSKVRRTIRCNWIHPERGRPEWHCDWACRPLPQTRGQGYWDSEVTRPAPHKTTGCHAWLPKWEFWGKYDLKCASDPPSTTSSPEPLQLNHTVRVNATRDRLEDNATRGRRPVTSTTRADTSIWAVNWTAFNTPEEKQCVTNKFRKLHACVWNVFATCAATNYVALSLRSQDILTEVVYTSREIGYEKWLNESFPWVSAAGLIAHFIGDFPEGAARSPDGLRGPYYSSFYVQHVPTPDDLLAVPAGEFDAIDQCVAGRIFASLNGSDWIRNGVSPRCDLVQTSSTFFSSWKYDCTKLKHLPTAKLVLQAWVENYYRNLRYGWWGLQEQELRAWVLPCLDQSSNYWIKYQYVATVYSKEQSIWPNFFWRPDLYVHPRPWRMECNTNRTVCDISLARKPCQAVQGWEDYCQEHYKDEYESHALVVRWRKIKGVWRRTPGKASTCTELILGHKMRDRKSIMGAVVPFIPDTLIAIAEGHAFRESLCVGEVDKGFEWVKSNLMYSNLSCGLPKEIWKTCGRKGHRHACHWYERLGNSVLETVTDVVEEVAEVVGQGLSIIEQWLLTILAKTWPYLLTALGVVIIAILCKVVLVEWIKAWFRPKGKGYKPLPGEGPDKV